MYITELIFFPFPADPNWISKYSGGKDCCDTKFCIISQLVLLSAARAAKGTRVVLSLLFATTDVDQTNERL